MSLLIALFDLSKVVSKTMKIRVGIALLGMWMSVSTTWAEAPLQLYYSERIPYAVADDRGSVHGLTATPAADAFKQAGVPFEWKKMPFKRQLVTLKYNKKRACGIGWFKKTEREAFARFTHPIYQDKPFITISAAGNDAVGRHGNVAGLLQDKQIRLLVKDGFSYGAYVDQQLKFHAPETLVVAGSSNLEMLDILLSGRADYFFVSEEEAEQMIEKSGHDRSRFQLNAYSDMPPGNFRYIACSKQVSPATVEALNAGLR